MLKRQCVHSFACQLHLLYLYNLWYFKSLIHKTQQSLGRVCSFMRKQPHSLLTCCPHSTICRQTHHYAQSTRMLTLGLRGSVWTKQGSLSLVIYKHNHAYSPSEGKVALEITTPAHAHCAPAPAGAPLPQLLWAVAWVSLTPCTLYCHVTDSEHDLLNVTPLPSAFACLGNAMCLYSYKP